MVDSPAILWVEDEESFRYAVTRALEDGGFRVITVPDTMAALKALDSEPRIGLLLADIHMPPGQPHGLALARMARLRRPELPLVFLTGYEDLARAAQTTGAKILPKSIEMRELIEAIRAQLGS